MIVNLGELRHQLLEENPRLKQPSITEFDLPFNDSRRMPRLSLAQQKKRAKELLKSLKAGETPALSSAYDVGVQNIGEEANLARCQYIIAKELGFHKWQNLKNHIEFATVAQQAIENGEPTALDAAKDTLHIRCGTDIKHNLAIAGFCGDFLAFSDPYCQGPVVETNSLEAFIDIRAKFISNAYNLSETNELRDGLAGEYSALDCARNYQSVNIWLEHDSYDQLILAKLLDYFSAPAHRPKQIKLITIEGFPGIKVFNGIGQLPPDALRVLWRNFEEVTEEQFAIGQQTWRALKSESPEALFRIVQFGTPKLPTMGKAVARHLQELPSLKNGLSLVEELTLRILADKGSINAVRLFNWYTNHYEPLTFLGDTQYWENIHRLAAEDTPAIVISKKGHLPKDWQVELTDIGFALLADSIDWLAITQSKRWVGGIQINPDDSIHWRVDRRSYQLNVKRS